MVGAISSLVGAAIGGTIGVIDTVRTTDHQIKEYEASLKALTEAFQLQTEAAMLQYENAKDTAFKTAAKQDAKTTMDEVNTSTNVNLALAGLQLQQEAEGLTWNQQAQANDASTGDAYSTLAASGTRSSSVQDAVKMQAAQNSQMLDISEKQQRNSDNLQLANILQGLNENKFDIQQNRTDAQDLRDSYAEDGYNYIIYQNELARMQQSYNTQYQQMSRAKDWLEENAVWNGIAAFFGGASTGAQVGSNIGDLTANLSNKFKTTGNYVGMKKTNVSAFSNGTTLSTNSAYYKSGAHW